MQATPSTWRLLLDAGWQGAAAFKALGGGEALPADLAHQLLRRARRALEPVRPDRDHRLVDLLAGRRVADAGIPIGRPIANTALRVLDDELQPLPGRRAAARSGIGGDGVTLGYLERPELTAERFVRRSLASRLAPRCYRTGDLRPLA